MPPRLHQTRLGSTPTHALTIAPLDPCCIPPQAPPDESLLLKLPDELLVSIVDYAARQPPFAPLECGGCWWSPASIPWSVKSIRALSRVCHRLQRLAQPLLFHTILFSYAHTIVPPTKPAFQLHRALANSPELRQHCRVLHIHVDDIHTPKPGWYFVANDLARWLTNTRFLSIGGGFCTDSKNKEDYKQTWALIRRCVAACQAIEHLNLTGSRGLHLASIFRWINCPNLKSLVIGNLAEWPHGAVRLAPEKRRTAPFTSLSLFACNERPEFIPDLLQWPAALTHFEFHHSYGSPNGLDYLMFTSWLLIHKETLTHVTLSTLAGPGSNRLFNATLFPNLHYLQLSRWQMASPVQFRIQDALDILGPRLETFSWGFFVMSCYWSGISFGENEISWVRQLVETAVSQKAALKTVEIAWPQELYYGDEETGRPWDAMFDVRDKVMTPNGIDLIYTAPILSREDWRLNRTKDDDAYREHRAAIDDPHSESEFEDSEEEEPELLWSDGYHGEPIRQYFLPCPGLTNTGSV